MKAGKAETTDLVALNPKKKIPFQLVEKVELSHNTRLFRFALQSPKHRLGLPIGQHMFFYAKVCFWPFFSAPARIGICKGFLEVCMSGTVHVLVLQQIDNGKAAALQNLQDPDPHEAGEKGLAPC